MAVPATSTEAPTCPKCGGRMGLRTGQRGQFWGCNNYRSKGCKGTVQVNEGKPVELMGPQAWSTVVPASDIPLCSLPLDNWQRAVVQWRVGEAVVAAGAGSGKSTVLVERVAALIREGVLPESVLTLAYNNEAAKVFRERLVGRLGKVIAKRCAVYTFHAWCWNLLRLWYPTEGRLSSIAGSGDDSVSIVPLILGAMKSAGVDGEWKDWVALMDRLRENLVIFESADALDRVGEVLGQLDAVGFSDPRKVATVFQAFQKAKKDKGCIDFADMVYSVGLHALMGHPAIGQLKGLYRHVQIDEAQDVNPARALIGETLGRSAESLVWVGDARQSVYAFSGARPDLFLGRVDQGGTLLALPVNRRCAVGIVDLGNRIAHGRAWHLGGDCLARDGAPEGELIFLNDRNREEEASQVSQWIRGKIGPFAPALNQFAVLARTNAELIEVEDALVKMGIPTRNMGTVGGSWSTWPGREFLAYLRSAEGIAHEDLSLIANKPKRYISKDVVQQVLAIASMRSMHLHEAIREVGGASELYTEFVGMARLDWKTRCDHTFGRLVSSIQGKRAGGLANEADDDKEKFYERLSHSARDAGSLTEIEKRIKAARHVKREDAAVVLSTVHRMKGLEASIVFLLGLGVKEPHSKNPRSGFPHWRNVLGEKLEEERRLLYVAVTRAKETLIVSRGEEIGSDFWALIGGDP